MRIATLSNPMAPGPMLGLQVAVQGYFTALVQSARLEKLYFIVQDGDDPRRLTALLAGIPGWGGGCMDKVSVINQGKLPDLVADGHLDVLHKGDPYIFDLVNSARCMGGSGLAVTGVTHSLNNMRDISQYIQLLAMGSIGREAVICTSAGARAVLENVFSAIRDGFSSLAQSTSPKLPIIPLGHDFPFRDIPREDARRKMGLAPNLKVIAYVGRIQSLVKGDLKPLMQVLHRLRKDHQDAFLLIAGSIDKGDRYEMDTLKQFAAAHGLAGQVGYVENYPPEQKGLIYATADVFVSPVDNFQETFGLSLLEAMWHGLPVVCSDWGGYRDLVEDGRTGFLIPTRLADFKTWDDFYNPGVSYLPLEYSFSTQVDLDVLHDRLDQLLKNQDLRLSMGASGRAKAQDFSWSAVINRYFDLWQDLKPSGSSRLGDHLRISQKEMFASYPSSLISAKSKVKKNESWMPGSLPHPHPLVRDKFDVGLMKKILATLDGGACGVQELLQTSGENEARVLLALGYMLKYGAICAVE